MAQETPMQAAERIFHQWHDFTRRNDIEAVLALYAPDAVLESPLVPVLLEGWPSGVLRGHQELRRFVEAAIRKRPKDAVRGYRTGRYFTDGRTLFWEYPRATPDGDQLELAEVMDLENGLIQHHRVYWGWVGFARLFENAQAKAPSA